MDIFFSINNREQVVQLPIVPSEFKIRSPVNNEVYTTINQGDIKLFGKRGLKSLVIDTFFPSKDYPFARDRTYKRWEYVEMFESWRDRELPIRMVVTDSPVNMLVTFDDFEYGYQDGSGDIYYSLSIEEFKLIKLQTKKVK